MTAPRQISEPELAEIKALNPVNEVAAKWVRLRRGGKLGLIGPCPIHSPKPDATDSTSFECSADSWVCAVCQEGGDVIKLVECVQQLDFRAAINWLGRVQTLNDDELRRRQAPRAATKQTNEQQNNEFRERERGKVFDIWKHGTPIAGTAVERYLVELRGLVATPGVKLRCIESMPYYASGAKDAVVIHRGPAMLGPLIRGGKFFGLHITYIDLNAPKGKLGLRDPKSGAELPAKKVRGSKAGAHIELVDCESPRRLIIGEGIEKVLAVWRALSFPAPTENMQKLCETAFWTSVDLGNLGGKAADTVPHPALKNAAGRTQRVPGPVPDLASPGIDIPESVEEIIILGDATSDRFTTECAIARAAARLAREGRSIKIAWAWDHGDFDDVLRDGSPLDDACRRIVAAINEAQPVAPPKQEQTAAPSTSRARKHTSNATGDSALGSPSHALKSEGGEPPAAQAFGYDVEALNREFALVLMGSKAVVFFEQQHALLEDQKRMLSIEAFNAWFANRSTQVVGVDGKIRTITWAKRWLNDKQRRSYRGVEFHPNPDGAPGTRDYLNLWSGFVVEPARERDPRKYKTFRDHLLNNVCAGNQDYFNWVFGFFAHIVQRPRERLGTALVMRGKMGTGKTKVGEIIGRLFPCHYFLVDDPRYVTGQFNAHMATCLLLQADEAVWAGDKAAEGRLKGLITAPIQQIEAKGIDPIRLFNYVRLIMTSNEEWVVPAGKDERRFAVLDVHPRCAQNHDYFREMDAELDNGGLEALLADLMAFDLDSIDLWRIPRTEALLEQKIRSLPSVDSWWFERLMSGATSRNGSRWRQQVSCSALFSDYLTTADKIGIRRKSEQTVFGIAMMRLVPGLERRKMTTDVEDERGVTVARRVPCYLLPPLSEARAAFEGHVEQRITWPLDDDDEPAGGVEFESRESVEF